MEIVGLGEESRRVVNGLRIQFKLLVALFPGLLKVADHADWEDEHILLMEVLRLTLVRRQLDWARELFERLCAR